MYNDNFKGIFTGQNHTFFVLDDEERSIYAHGENFFGQLGLGIDDCICTYTKLVDFSKSYGTIVKIVCGTNHTIFVALKNEEICVYSCGSNDCGQLGLGDTDDRDIPTKITTLPNQKLKNVFCEHNNTIFVYQDDYNNVILYGCGDINGNYTPDDLYDFNKFIHSSKCSEILDFVIDRADFKYMLVKNSFDEYLIFTKYYQDIWSRNPLEHINKNHNKHFKIIYMYLFGVCVVKNPNKYNKTYILRVHGCVKWSYKKLLVLDDENEQLISVICNKYYLVVITLKNNEKCVYIQYNNNRSIDEYYLMHNNFSELFKINYFETINDEIVDIVLSHDLFFITQNDNKYSVYYNKQKDFNRSFKILPLFEKHEFGLCYYKKTKCIKSALSTFLPT